MGSVQNTECRALRIPHRALVILIGASGSGKSTFARRHFGQFQVVSSDHCRAVLCDDETNQDVTPEAFALMHHIVDGRLRLGRLTVADATNVEAKARRPLVALARDHGFTPVAIVFDIDESDAQAQNAQREHRQVPPAVIGRQLDDLRASKPKLGKEGFAQVYALKSPTEIAAAKLEISYR